MPFKRKRIAITGGSGDIGRRIVSRLIEQGAEVTVFGRSPPEDPRAVHIACDLVRDEGLEAAAAALAASRWDVLINLAGMQYFGRFEDESAEHLGRTFALNLVAPVRLAQAVTPKMKCAGQGRIVNVGSIFGSINFAHFASYSSSKAGLRAFSQALRRELAGSGVEVTYVAPRAVETRFNSPKVRAFAQLTKMAMDDPDAVAGQILEAVSGRKREVYLGFPEAFFVRLNALLPHLVDQALAAKDRRVAQLFS